jgi:hypothetical protein
VNIPVVAGTVSLGSTATALWKVKHRVLRVRRATDQGHRRHPWAAMSGHSARFA